MIRDMKLIDVGPARTLDFQFAPRLNVVTGDNGLGKTFVLDLLWWFLTATWAGEKAFPFRPRELEEGNGFGDGWGRGDGNGFGGGLGEGAGKSWSGGRSSSLEERTFIKPSLQAHMSTRARSEVAGSEYHINGLWDWPTQEWRRSLQQVSEERPAKRTRGRLNDLDEKGFDPQSLVIYARIDGSYAVFDSFYLRPAETSLAEAAIVLSASELWDGKEVADHSVPGGKRTAIKGLIADWVNWQQRAQSSEFKVLRELLAVLSAPDEALTPADPTRVHLRDRRDIPCLKTSNGLVPVTLASAGVKRALSLAYLLVWSWTEHEKAAIASHREPTQDVVLLIDEPELHQHPAWQRCFLPSIMKALNLLAPEVEVQVFAATHSPLVLASLENLWHEDRDDLFLLQRNGRAIKAIELPFTKEGEVSSWLSSMAFGQVAGRSLESELAIAAAMDFMAGRENEAEEKIAELEGRWTLQNGTRKKRPPSKPKSPLAERIHAGLKATLPGHDRFWSRWVMTWEQFETNRASR